MLQVDQSESSELDEFGLVWELESGGQISSESFGTVRKIQPVSLERGKRNDRMARDSTWASVREILSVVQWKEYQMHVGEISEEQVVARLSNTESIDMNQVAT
jgi:hypothetical protein